MSSSSNSYDDALKDAPLPPVEVEVPALNLDNSATSSTAAAAVDTSDVADWEGYDKAHNTSPTAGTTKEAANAVKEVEKKRLINLAKALKLEDVVLTKERNNSETLGVCKWSDLKAYVMM